jgi:O-antigen/teichoic acid export membrane protein
VVAGLALGGRWVVRLLTAPSFYDANKALPWVALGWAMYGLWVVFLVIAGRAHVTTRNFPAAIAGLAANVVLLLVLVPPLGIAGAGIALCGAYVAMLGVMHFLTRRLFEVAFEWRRLAQIVLVMGGIAAIGDLVLPTHGAVGLLSRIAAFLAIVPLLYITGFAHPEELGNLRRVLGRVGAGPRGRAG